jgi:hypothetical protein
MYKGMYQGKFTPDNPSKYVGDASKIIYRSSWERRVMQYMDKSSNVTRWASEEIVIPYLSPVDGEVHRYFVDFWMEVRVKDTLKRYLIEVKPSQFCQLPKQRKSKKYLEEVKMYAVNDAKWKAAKQFAKKHGMDFIVITEKDLGL